MIPPEPPEPTYLLRFGSSALSPDSENYRAYDWVEIISTNKRYSVAVALDEAKGTGTGVFIIPKTGHTGPVGIARKVQNTWVYKFDGVTYGAPSGYTVSAPYLEDWETTEHVTDDPDLPLNTLGSTTEYSWSNED